MNILVVGGGAREHAIAWKLINSPQVDKLFITPGNGGTTSICTNLRVSPEDIEGIASLAEAQGIELTVVGPEQPLAKGIVDRFRERGLTIFGPSAAAAQLEASKAFSKDLMSRHDIPCPEFKVFHDYSLAHDFLSRHQGPVVVKADGLAAGKGAFICDDREESLKALRVCMVDRTFGAAGDTVVVEEYLEGQEVSIFSFSDGEHLSPLAAACDYKRLKDGDFGPNTGGMGSYCPPAFWTDSLKHRIMKEVMDPVVKAMKEDGTPYQGILYAGLMVTSQGPKVLEFNCRFGDPEAQVILPLLATDLVDVLFASAKGGVDKLAVEWVEGTCVGVVMASGGYPGDYPTGLPISGLEDVDDDVQVFHAGTKVGDAGGKPQLVSDGGRVLTVVGRGATRDQARQRVYANIERVHFQGSHYRKDIALISGAA